MSPRARREATLRVELVEAGRRMHQAGFAAGSDGNLSARLDPEHILITPSGLAKGRMHPEQLLVVDLDGKPQPSFHPRRRHLKPSSEINMHLEAYRRRDDVRAVIHAHPPLAIACTVAAIPLDECVLPEIIYHLGSIPTAPYATPGTAEGAASVRELVKHHDALLLDHHGTLTLGDSVEQALMRLEWVEQAAQIMLAAHAATGGRPAEMPPAPLERLLALRKGHLAAEGNEEKALCTTCRRRAATPAPSPDRQLIETVVEAVLAAIGDGSAGKNA